MQQATTSHAAIALANEAGAEYVVCNLCGRDETTELYRRSDYRFEVDDIEWPLVQCNRCGLAYTHPRPAPGCDLPLLSETFLRSTRSRRAAGALRAAGAVPGRPAARFTARYR